MKLEEVKFNRGADITIGILLLLCCLIGVFLNTISLVSFYTMKTKSRNATYFQWTYRIICATDLLICLTLFPHIDAAFSPKRHGTLYPRSGFCDMWSVLWTVLPEMSVFMVAFLSVSRLVILVKPYKIYNPIVSWTVPLGYCAATTVFKVILLLTDVTRSHYAASGMSCRSIVNLNASSSDSIPTAEDWSWDVCIRVLESIQSGMTVLPILVSCCLSVFFLHRSKKTVTAESRNKSCNQKKECATVTVIIITGVYIIFNIPILWYQIFFAKWTSTIDTGNLTIAEIYKSRNDYLRTDFLRNYAIPVLGTSLVALNSVVNPLVYYTRMISFREFVDTLMKKIMGKRESLVLGSLTLNSLTNMSK